MLTSTPLAPAAPPGRTPGASGSCAGQTEPDDHAIQIHLACDGHGRPLPVLVTAGQAHDTTRFTDLLAGIRFPRRPGPGGPPTRPDRILADKANSSRAIRVSLRRRSITAVIPERRDQQDHRRNRGRAGGRPPHFNREVYKRRTVIERCFNRLKQYRAIATGYQAMLDLATLLIWL